MKSPLILLGLAGVTLAAPPMSDRITPEEIAARRKSSPLATLSQPGTPADAKVAPAEPPSLVEQSEILSDGIHWTIVPKGAVLHVPDAMATKVGTKPLGTLLTWIEFLTVNRSWLFTEEVTFDQAAGKRPIPPSRPQAWGKLGKVIVAVHMGGPISVRTQPTPPVASTR